jgi:Tetratricopeptide repeat
MFGIELYRAGKYLEATLLSPREFAILEKARGPGHPDVATALNSLAVLYAHQDRYTTRC